MSTTEKGFISYEKRGNKTYAYRRINQRDPITKKVKCVSKTYLGTVDPKTQKLTKVKDNIIPRNVFSFGDSYLISEIFKQLKLDKILSNIYGELDYQKIKELVTYKITTSNPLYLFSYWKEENYNQTPTLLKGSSGISKFISAIGSSSKLREDFFKEWSKNLDTKHGVMFDLTSISSHSDNIEYSERGFNKDGDDLNQVNIGMIYSQSSGLPVAYRSYPGSLRDVTTIKNIIGLFKSLTLEIVFIVLDRGFYSINNLRYLYQNNLNFIISIPQNRKIAANIVKENGDNLMSPSNSMIFNGESLFAQESEDEFEDKALTLHLYCDQMRQALEIKLFMMKLDSIEKDFTETQFNCIEDAREYLDDINKKISRCFELTEDDKNIFIAKNDSEINRILSFKGKFILATNAGLASDRILDLYKSKDEVEKVFCNLKSELKEKKFRTKNSDTFEGKMFINFLCLIVVFYIRRKMKKANLYKKYSFKSLLATLRKLKVYTLSNNKNTLAEITAQQKDIYKKLDISIPRL